jgi:uncharacterized protein
LTTGSAPFPVDHGSAGGNDTAEVTALLGRPPAGAYQIVVRRRGRPAVIENGPHLHDGTPMPTRYWLVDPGLREAVSRLESGGGVRLAESEVDAGALATSHAAYAARRDAAIEPGHSGPRPSGGVGGTRQGVKCLHAHLAWWLVGGQDPVGAWLVRRLPLGLLTGLEPGRAHLGPDGVDVG